ncbi:MAG: molecular chaperone DnaJ [bacterium]
MSKDYYKILGVDKNASKDEIKKAFHKLAHEHHPIKGGNAEKFKEANEAYQVLSDDKKRAQYDNFGSSFEHAQAGGGFSGFNGFRDFSGFANGFEINMDDLGDMFGDFFGGGRSQRASYGPKRGGDMEVSMAIDFNDAVFGVEKEIELEKIITCDHCHGNGAEPGSKIETCPECKGTGQIKHTQQTILGTFQTASVCPSCKGAGKRPEKNCVKCGGAGAVRGSQKVKVKIPAGIDNGETIKLSGQGEAGRGGGQSGDLYIIIKVKPSHKFRRDGYDIYTKEYISFKQAALGDKINIETIHDGVKLKILEGTQTGTVFKLKGKGVQKLRGFGHGDHFVEVIIRTPENLTRAQKKAMEELD